MKKCMRCHRKEVSNSTHDLCYSCFKKQENTDESLDYEDHFEENLDTNEVHTVYVMFYPKDNKIGYTKDLESRIIEIKRKYPRNKLVYFREFLNETEARRFEQWLKDLSERELIKFIASFQNKIRKVESF